MRKIKKIALFFLSIATITLIFVNLQPASFVYADSPDGDNNMSYYCINDCYARFPNQSVHNLNDVVEIPFEFDPDRPSVISVRDIKVFQANETDMILNFHTHNFRSTSNPNVSDEEMFLPKGNSIVAVDIANYDGDGLVFGCSYLPQIRLNATNEVIIVYDHTYADNVKNNSAEFNYYINPNPGDFLTCTAEGWIYLYYPGNDYQPEDFSIDFGPVIFQIR